MQVRIAAKYGKLVFMYQRHYIDHPLPNLRSLRENIGMSGHDLAYIAGISATSLYTMETTPTNPRYNTLTYIAVALALESNTPPSKVFRELLGASLFEPYYDLREELKAKLGRTS